MKNNEQIIFLVNRYYQTQKHRLGTENQIRALKAEGKDTSFLESFAQNFKAIESDISKLIAAEVKKEPMFKWFKGVKGIGPLMAASLLACIDIEKAQHASSVLQYAGLTPNSVKKAGQKINWNPFLKATCWRIGEQFVKSKGKYRKIYDDSKEYYKRCHPKEEKVKGTKIVKYTDGHIHSMAKRRAVKIFLIDMWEEWRVNEGLRIDVPYMHRGDEEFLKANPKYLNGHMKNVEAVKDVVEKKTKVVKVKSTKTAKKTKKVKKGKV